MTYQQILEKAITKAIEGGWLPPSHIWDNEMTKENVRYVVREGVRDISFGADIKGRVWLASADNLTISDLIYNHDFAKALWGTEWIDTGVPNGATWKEENITEIAWQYHLQQMVIADNPIAYLGENI